MWPKSSWVQNLTGTLVFLHQILIFYTFLEPLVKNFGNNPNRFAVIQDTVDFIANYDGRSQEPTVLPSRFPNLLVNGSAGIAVGMATNIPPHNLNEVVEATCFALENPEMPSEQLLAKLVHIRIIQ